MTNPAPDQIPETDPAIQDELRAAFPAEMLAGLMGRFANSVRVEQRALAEAWARGDSQAASATAHRIASAAAQYGFPRLNRLAKAAERQSRGSEPADPALPAALDQALERALALSAG